MFSHANQSAFNLNIHKPNLQLVFGASGRGSGVCTELPDVEKATFIFWWKNKKWGMGRERYCLYWTKCGFRHICVFAYFIWQSRFITLIQTKIFQLLLHGWIAKWNFEQTFIASIMNHNPLTFYLAQPWCLHFCFVWKVFTNRLRFPWNLLHFPHPWRAKFNYIGNVLMFSPATSLGQNLYFFISYCWSSAKLMTFPTPSALLCVIASW